MSFPGKIWMASQSQYVFSNFVHPRWTNRQYCATKMFCDCLFYKPVSQPAIALHPLPRTFPLFFKQDFFPVRYDQYSFGCIANLTNNKDFLSHDEVINSSNSILMVCEELESNTEWKLPLVSYQTQK